jgi:hypothetical protein
MPLDADVRAAMRDAVVDALGKANSRS